MKTIKLSIQEIINDFENLISDEVRIGTKEDISFVDDYEYEEYYQANEDLCKKYIPNYLELVGPRYHNEETQEKGYILYNMLYKNFKEILYNLV